MAGETQAKTVAISASSQEVAFLLRYSTIVIYNATTAAVYVTTDGSPASSSTGTTTSVAVPAGTQSVFGNSLPIADTAGGTNSLVNQINQQPATQSTANLLGTSWQAFSGSTDSTNMTQVNVVGGGTGNVTVEVQ